VTKFSREKENRKKGKKQIQQFNFHLDTISGLFLAIVLFLSEKWSWRKALWDILTDEGSRMHLRCLQNLKSSLVSSEEAEEAPQQAACFTDYSLGASMPPCLRIRTRISFIGLCFYKQGMCFCEIGA